MIGYGVVGSGYFGAELARIMNTKPGAVIRAVHDPENGAAVAAELGCDAEGSLKALVSRKDIQAVIVATPNYLHKEPVLAAAAHGLNVFCEKPIALSYGDCREMVRACQDNHVIFMAGHVMNFFRGLPKAIEESAIVDGAGQFTIMLKIILPLSKASIATITLFSVINNWNAWYDGLLYNNYTQNYPLQTYLQSLLNMTSDLSAMMKDIKSIIDRQAVTARNLTAAQIFISIIPLMCAYPFMQKYFTKGLVMGSVKG